MVGFGPVLGHFNHDELAAEQMMLIGTMFSWMAYALWKRPKSMSRLAFIFYVSLLFGFISAYMALDTANKVRAFTTYKGFPGGPDAWLRSKRYSDVFCIAGNVCVVCSIWLSDGFLLYRAVKVYTTRQWILLVPCLLYVASVVTGGLYLSEQVDSNTVTWETLSFAVPYFICASLCNLSTIFTIAARLLWFRHLVRRVVGPEKKEHGELYKSAFTIFVESAALYAVFSIVFIVSYAMRSAVEKLVVAPLANVRGIASFLILLRLVKRAIVNETSACKKALERLSTSDTGNTSSSVDLPDKENESLALVEQAIIHLEDDPYLNAGYGSNLTLDGIVECDASLCVARPLQSGDVSQNLLFGSVGAVSGIKNPILAARCVLEYSENSDKLGRILPMTLVSSGAVNFVQKYGKNVSLVPTEDMVSLAAERTWKKWKDRLENETVDRDPDANTDEKDQENLVQDTVGAIAWHPQGGFAAGVSSGGILLKFPGRIGEAAVFGAGCWAQHCSESLGGMACSVSGTGEEIVRANLARNIGNAHLQSTDPHEVLRKILVEQFWQPAKTRGVHDPAAGVVMMTKETDEVTDSTIKARVWCGFTAASMAIAFASGRDPRPKVLKFDCMMRTE
ncbi:Threonine aspartase 1 [Leucoagaricus sp. SymC.cos]|nr:Threonine aspartase 1 [Leucoagaricus sp. SymC.cos]